ncbi:uncharacterized protein tasor2 isoform 2-T2 [Menidia menidia]
MESGNGAASSKGVLIPVSESSEVFMSSVLAPLQSSYLYDESKQCFRYKSALLVRNPALEEKYYAFREKKKDAGYSEHDLSESYGFLLFDDKNKTSALGESGLLSGNSTCTTLGDPSKGVYISMYSDCLDLNRWYHGKSGYIAIFKLTKGKVKKVAENYTQNFTEPTVGFDCHVSEQLPSVSAKTSSFLAFERTQYYIYELLDDGSNGTALCPSALYPFAIVSFSYTDTKEAPPVPEERSEMKKTVCHYLAWKGQLQIDSQLYALELRSTAGALIPAKLQSVVKIDKVISMSTLRQLLPKAVFEARYTEEVFLDGFYCSLCEFVGEETNSFALLLREIKEKNLALAAPLNDGGFLILLHFSQFFTYHDHGTSPAEVLQGIFVFPDSRVVRRDTKFGQNKFPLSAEILQILPALSYAESEVEKTPLDPGEELCEVLAQHIQSYATLINPGLVISPSREVSIFPDQYDVTDAHKHLYSTPEWTDQGWESIKSYLSKPNSFQLPVSKVSEIVVAGQEERREDLVDDVYICLSSPEEAPASPVQMESDKQLLDQQAAVNVENPVDIDMPSVEPDNLQPLDLSKDDEKSMDLAGLDERNDVGEKGAFTSPSENLSSELIVSITSAERSSTDETVNDASALASANPSGFHFPGFPTGVMLPTPELNSLCGETDKTKTVLKSPKVTNGTGAQPRKLHRGVSKAQKSGSKACVEAHSLQVATAPLEVVSLNCQVDERTKEPDRSLLSHPLKKTWRKYHRRKRRFGKLRNKKLIPATVGSAVVKKADPGQHTLETAILQQLETIRLKKKTERWDLKPVVSECGRILVPHGSLEFAHNVKSVVAKLQTTKDEQQPKDAALTTSDSVEMEKKTSTASEMAVDEMVDTKPTDGADNAPSVTNDDPDQVKETRSEGLSDSVPLPLETKAAPSENEDPGAPAPEAAQEKQIKPIFPGKSKMNGGVLLSRLKSVLSRRKRKKDLTVTPEETDISAQDSALSVKKVKVDSDSEAAIQSPDVGINQVSKEPTVDPVFAYALGLTPINSLFKAQTTEAKQLQDNKKDSETQELTSADQQHQIMQRPPSIFPKRVRIKTLKKHQGMSAENVKKKWWLHFQTPACFASENLKNNDCTKDNSVRKTVKGKMKKACSSTDALNLLADLALGANNDQVPLQSNPALGRKSETSLKKLDLTKGLTRAEQESVLHALLRQPAAKFIQPHKSPSPSPLVGDSDLVGLVTTEHAYSLPPSSSLLLDLPGTPFQVLPLSGSTRLLHHYQTMYGDGLKTLHPPVVQEDISENNRTSNFRLKHRRKFRHSRSFVMKAGAIQVTKEWKENYDFNLDSRFTSDPKDKTILRALHGPWDLSIQDTREEVRLIFHMWIGLFYSRTTARFFQDDSSPRGPSPKGNYSLQKDGGMASGPLRPSLRTNPSASISNKANTPVPLVSEALDFSKKDASATEAESEILDLSLKNLTDSSGQHVSPKRTLRTSDQTEQSDKVDTLQSPGEPKECEKKIGDSTRLVGDLTYGGSIHENKMPESQTAKCPEYTDAASSERDGTATQEEMQSAPVQLETVPTPFRIGEVLLRPNKKNSDMKAFTENSDATENCLVSQKGMDSSKSLTGRSMVSGKEKDGVGHTEEHDEQELQALKSCKVKKNPCSEISVDHPQEVLQTSVDESENGESGIFCSENDFDQQKLPCTALSSDQADINGNEIVSRTCEGTELKDVDGLQEDELDQEQSCISAMQADLMDKPLVKSWDGYKKDDRISECDPQAQMDELPVTESTKEALSNMCADPIAQKDQCSNENISNSLSEICLTSAGEEKLEGIRLVDLNHGTKLALAVPSECTSSADESQSDLNFSQPKDVAKEGNESRLSDLNGNVSAGQETKSAEEEEPTEETTLHEPFQNRPRSPKCDITDQCEAGLSFAEETDYTTKETMDEQEKSWTGVVIPFIGRDISGAYAVQSQAHVEETFKGQQAVPFENENVDPISPLPHVLDSTSQVCNETEQSAHTISLLDESETHSFVFCDAFDNRCPTPTIDEKPDEQMPSLSTNSSTPALTTPKFLNRASMPVNDEPSLEQKCPTTTVNTYPSPHPDLELRTLRVLQSIGRYLSKSNQADSFTQNDLAVGLPDHSSKPFVSAEGLRDEHKASPPSLNQEPPLCSQRPVMAVKPSKSDESQLNYSYKDAGVETTTLNKKICALLLKNDAAHTGTVEPLVSSNGPVDNHNIQELSSKTTPLPSVTYFKYNLEENKLAQPGCSQQYQEANISKLNTVPVSPLPIESFESTGYYPEGVDGNQGVPSSSLHEKVKQKTRNMNSKGCSHKLPVRSKDDTVGEKNEAPGSEGSLICTIFNNDRKRSPTMLEQLSQRCLPKDLTQASLEQECLIFSQKIKTLLKKSRRGPICKQEEHDGGRLSGTSPLVVSFSNLKEQEDSLDFVDKTLFEQKISVNIPKKEAVEKEKTLHPQAPSQEGSHPVEHAGISGMTAQFAKLYEAKMQDVCSVRKASWRQKSARMQRNRGSTKSSNHFDFCHQMKKELDETFRSNLNAVVKKSCRRKYRFHILATSDDVFFEETKVQLEAKGHTVVQPSEFFLGEGSSSSLLIILRNEDIAEHITEVPHLLKLKLSPDVQFAGIDEPDDVVNLTHQELFTRGGFIMVDRTVLEPLSLCDMKRITEILEELSKMGKWKWMLHYRDSRRLKENARLSSEANEKKQLFLWGQDAGILEVLPYHECDLMSKDHPDYLACLLRLQVQNISSRYTVFITDTKTQSAFEKNGILTVTLNEFVTKSPSEMLTA